MRKPDFCMCENKAVFATQIVHYIKNSSFLTCFCDCTGQSVSDLVRNREDRFSRVVAHISYVVILAVSMVVIKIISQLSYLFVL